MSIESNAKIVSVVGGCRRSGRWIVPAETDMMTLFGRAVIDLREARTSAEQLEFTCLSVFANITFLVPEGAEVRPSGMAILGSSRSTVPISDVECHLPPMSVDATTIFGRIRIRTTDLDPEDSDKTSFWSRFKRDKQTPAEPAGTRDGGVDLQDTPAEPATPEPGLGAPAPVAAAAAPARVGSIDALGGPPEPTTGLDAVGGQGAIPPSIVSDESRPLPEGTLSDRPTAFGDELEEPSPGLGVSGGSANADALGAPAEGPTSLSAPITSMPDPQASPIEGFEAPDDISEIDTALAADNAARRAVLYGETPSDSDD